MNCRQLKDQLFEYVEGSLSAAEHAVADAHLAQCAACRQAVRQEQQTAQILSSHLRQKTEGLVLRPEIRRRLLAPRVVEASFWSRFAWPLGMAASLILALTLFLTQHFSTAPTPLSIETSYRVPIQISFKQGNQIIDELSYETIKVSETLWTDPQKPAKQEPKTQL